MNFSYQDYYTENFYQWEQRGRGSLVFSQPVHIEPPFAPFFHPHASAAFPYDDGEKLNIFGHLQNLLSSHQKSLPPVPKTSQPIQTYPFTSQGSICELGIIPAQDQNIRLDTAMFFLGSLSTTSFPVSFEVIGTHDVIKIQLACWSSDFQFVRSQLLAYFPEAIITDQTGYLKEKWNTSHESFVVDMALGEEFMRPINSSSNLQTDLLAGVIAALESLEQDELGMLQIIFQGAHNPWGRHMLRSVTDSQGRPFFVNSPEMLPLAREKTASPLYGVVIRVFGQSFRHQARAMEIIRYLMGSLSPLNNQRSNYLAPVFDPDYPLQTHITNVLKRQTHRAGMILNQQELVSLVHLPTPTVVSEKLRSFKKSKAAPAQLEPSSAILGYNNHQNKQLPVTLSTSQRLRHMHLIGATGTGKSTLLLHMMKQDMDSGSGFTLLDPHGDLVEAVIAQIPPSRKDDVILIDPSDSEYAIGLNLLSAKTDLEKVVISSDLIAMFRRFATSWGDNMGVVLANAIDAMIDHPKGGTLLDLRRFLIEKDFRKEFLVKIKDQNIRYYWEYEYPQVRSNSLGSLLTRLNTFLRPPIIRAMIGQKEGLDLHAVLREGKIVLVKLAQGIIGEENSYLLGTLLVAKLQQAAQARQAIPQSQRNPYFLYIDEFQHFITPSMKTILSGARKYGLGLILAHQDLQQLSRSDSELANAVISNPFTRICFRLGDFDAKKLESGFQYFQAEDLQNLGVGEAIARLGQARYDFNLNTYPPPRLNSQEAHKIREHILFSSRSKLGKPISEVLEQVQYNFKPHKKKETSQKQSPPIEIPQTSPVQKLPESVSEPIQDSSTDWDERVEKYKENQRKIHDHSQHQKLQSLVKKVAEGFGYLAIIEEPIDKGQGKVDVGLEKGEEKIAVEISVTTSPDHELGNISKCLTAGYSKVVVISEKPEHLKKIQSLAMENLGSEEYKRVSFLSPERFPSILTKELPSIPKGEQQIKGRRVKTNFHRPDTIEREDKQQMLNRIIRESRNENKGQ